MHLIQEADDNPVTTLFVSFVCWLHPLVEEVEIRERFKLSIYVALCYVQDLWYNLSQDVSGDGPGGFSWPVPVLKTPLGSHSSNSMHS